MKNILNISVIAALAILPMAANATPVAGDPTHSNAASGLTTDAQPKWALAEANSDVDGNVATAGYVKGAYNAAMKAINTIADTAGNALTASSTATLTNKSIDANGTGNSITNLETDNFATGVVVTTVGAEGLDTALPTEKAVRGAITTATDGMVTLTGTQTLTSKTIDADNNTISNLEADNFKTGVVSTSVRASGTATDTNLVSEKAVRDAIDGLSSDYAKKIGVTNTISSSTIAGTVPAVTVWGTDTPGTVDITASITGATYTETAPTPATPEP